MVEKPVVVVTGASKGLGLAITKILLEEFNAVVVALSRSQNPGMAELHKAHHDSLLLLECDVTDATALKSSISQAAVKYQRLDALILNAGVLEPMGTIVSQGFTARTPLCRTIAQEESDVTFVALRPGMVDTSMQALVRGKGALSMKEEDHLKFMNVHATGQLVKPEDAGYVAAALSLQAPSDLSGQFLSWDSEICKDYWRGCIMKTTE
ncbi:putative oxidoreductase C30D10.05c [Grifola frondosa]|uniref:Putative oxidoreductase C30D10.05c n=1 Tax=Grifola frondosa TaxID=5627 RepID=A0A1C7M204_GRIFR|nr:putative oxidoreductase C30D10.05c [Grifola frondosa]